MKKRNRKWLACASALGGFIVATAPAAADMPELEKRVSEIGVYLALCTNPEITELSPGGMDMVVSATSVIGDAKLLARSNALLAQIGDKRHEFCVALTPKMKDVFQHKQPTTTGERPFTFGGPSITVMLPGQGNGRGIRHSGSWRQEPDWRKLSMRECAAAIDADLALRDMELSNGDMFVVCDRLTKGFAAQMIGQPRGMAARERMDEPPTVARADPRPSVDCHRQAQALRAMGDRRPGNRAYLDCALLMHPPRNSR